MSEDKPRPSVRLDQPTWALSKDRHKVSMTLPMQIDGHKHVVAMNMDSDTVDEVLQGLSALRAKMTAEHPHKFQENGAIAAISEPALHSWIDQISGKPILSLHHPGFGWLHFALSKQVAANLGGRLQSQSSAPQPLIPGHKN